MSHPSQSRGPKGVGVVACDTELVQYATEIKVRAERRCGELLADADLGISRDQSSRYQKLAAMPEDQLRRSPR